MRRHPHILRAALSLGGLCLAWAPEASAQSTFLYTGSGQALKSEIVTPTAEAPRPIFNWLEFIIGFSTEEPLRANVIPDSATVTVLFGDNIAATIATSDITGTVWQPETPGGLQLPAGSIIPVATTFPVVDPLLPTSSAFKVRVNLPPEYANLPVKVVVDLFDNRDSFRSIAFLGDVAVVPEPSALGLIGLGAAACLLARRSRRS